MRYLVILILACTASRALAEPPTCETTAVPDDGIDDRAAIWAACVLRRCAHLPAGRYEIATPPVPRSSAVLVIDDCDLHGDGPQATTIRFAGDVGGADWEGIRATGASAKVRDLRIETGEIAGETSEQTHAIRVLGPATDVELERLAIDHPIREGRKGGDCIQLVGYPGGRMIERARIADIDFLRCDRSGVAAHSGVTDLDIIDSRFWDVGNSDVDFEGSGSISRVTIAWNRFALSPGLHGVGAIQLQLVTDARVTGNVLEGRGIDVYQSDDVRIDHNDIVLTQATGAPVIAVTKDSSRVRIIHNQRIERAASAGPGAVIRAAPHGTGVPDHLTIGRNVIRQLAAGHVIDAAGVVGLDVADNAVTFAGPPRVWSGVLANGSAAVRTTDITVAGNTWAGPLRQVLAVSGSYAGCGSVTTRWNVAPDVSRGVYCASVASGAGVLGPVVSVRDAWAPSACAVP